MSFMGALFDYNQIKMYGPYREHTSFITEQELYYYRVMSFRLKNVRATYQQMVNKMFAKQLGQNKKVYINDMLVKSKKMSSHLVDLTKAFDVLRWYKLKLNLEKCAFGVASGKFLGFIVNQNGIEANLEKIKDVLEMELPKNLK